MLTDLLRMTARQVVGLLKAGKVSPAELIDASLARIGEVEPAVNALPTLCPERARKAARRLDPKEAAHPGWLAGLPIAIKDLTEVEGVRTTFGSPIYADHVSPHSDILVENLERHGGVVLAKSNTPEFGAGANTFNEVFGKTRNPWNTDLTCGGSSGGAATALAAGEIWLATGSDLGGSLRIPASFCSVVGLRPSPGRVARAPTKLPFDLLSVQGPMGRTVGDVALLLDAMSGEDASDPISLPAPAVPFQAAVDRPTVPRRVALSLDLGGLMPVDAEVRAATIAAAKRFESLGARVEEACPDLSASREVFQVLRAIRFAANLQPLLESHRELLKPDVVWNIEAGLKLNGGDVAAAERGRTRIFQSVATFFETYDLLLTPAVIVPPFAVDQRYVTEVDGHRFETYIDWLIASFAITLTSCPALSLPAGFTADGRPIGVQLVGPAHGEAALLSAAASLETALGLAALTPIDPRQNPVS